MCHRRVTARAWEEARRRTSVTTTSGAMRARTWNNENPQKETSPVF